MIELFIISSTYKFQNQALEHHGPTQQKKKNNKLLHSPPTTTPCVKYLSILLYNYKCVYIQSPTLIYLYTIRYQKYYDQH